MDDRDQLRDYYIGLLKEDCSVGDLCDLRNQLEQKIEELEQSQEKRRERLNTIRKSSSEIEDINTDEIESKIDLIADKKFKYMQRYQVLEDLLDEIGSPDTGIFSLQKSEVSKRNTKTEIAIHILNVLENREDKPNTRTGLLRCVDDRRGTEKDSTYRYLWDQLPDKDLDSLDSLIEWAKEKV